MSSTDFTTRARELGGDQQLLLPEVAESRIDFGLRMWMLNLRSPRTVETYTKTMTRFRAFLGSLGYDLDGDRRIVALVVDDSITVRRVTQRLLQREGYRVVLAADGLQALERLADELPTVVLSDIEMPRMDGFDLARNIRGDERLKHLPIIMITSRIAEKHREHAMELGVNNYLGKPYSEEELLSLVRHYCGTEVAA